MTVFSERSLVAYGLAEDAPALNGYLSDDQMDAASAVNKAHAWKLNDKTMLSTILEPFKANIVTTFGAVFQQKWEPIDTRLSLPHLLEASNGIAIMKPIFGTSGEGVDRIDLSTWKGSEALSFLGAFDGQVVTDFVYQGEYAMRIWPYVSNTVRVMTFHVPGDNEWTMGAVHRFGLHRSVWTDNWNQGGASAMIDVTNGIMGPLVFVTYEQDPIRWETQEHPRTLEQVAGVRVPYWEELKRLVTGMTKHLAYLPYIAWDFVITDYGPVLLEANADPGVRSFQAHGGLLNTPDLARFYEWAGVLNAD